MSTFSHVDFKDLEEIKHQLKSCTSLLPPIKTKLFKPVSHCFTNHLVNFINSLLQPGIFPVSLTCAVITILLELAPEEGDAESDKNLTQGTQDLWWTGLNLGPLSSGVGTLLSPGCVTSDLRYSWTGGQHSGKTRSRSTFKMQLHWGHRQLTLRSESSEFQKASETAQVWKESF